MSTLITGGLVVFDTGAQKADILIEDGKITGIFAPGCGGSATKIIDADGLAVFPGTIDAHFHLGIYNDLAADFEKDTQGAAIGGLTSFVNFWRGNGSYFDTLPHFIETGEKKSLVDFSASLGIVTKYHYDEIERYVRELQVTSFKFYCGYQDHVSEIFGIPAQDALSLNHGDMYFIFKKIASISPRLLMCVHAEDAEIFNAIGDRVKKSGDPQKSLKEFAQTRPDFAETLAVMSAIYLNSVVGGKMHIVHLSSGSSVDMIENLRAVTGSRFTVETCPQYLLLTEDAPCNLDAKVYPPIKTVQDRERLWDGLKKGILNTVGTDNCPQFLAGKYGKGRDMWSAWAGFPGAGYILPALISEGYHKRGMSLERIAQISSSTVARTFNLETKGAIRPGVDADLALVDLDWEREIGPDVYGNTDFSIYNGMKMKGWPRYTLSRGEIIQRDGKIVAPSGRGRFIRRHI